jgi:hypothetical protein
MIQFLLPLILKSKTKLIAGGIILLVLLTTHSCAYLKGKQNCNKAYAEAETSVLKDELERKGVEAVENARIAEEVGRETAVMDARLDRALEELDEAIAKANAVGGACKLSPDELRAFEALSNSYQ